MMKRVKLIISILLAILLCASSCTVAFAEGETSGTCGDGVTWSYDTETNALVIDGNGAMTDYAYGSTPWNSYMGQIKTVTFTGGVTHISQYALCDSYIKEVEIPSSVKSIGRQAFASTHYLRTVTLNEGLEDIGIGVFYGSAVTTISPIPASVKSIAQNAFVSLSSYASTQIDKLYVLSKDCTYPDGEGSQYDVFYNSLLQPTIYFYGGSTTEEYLKRVEHENYVVLCLDGTENHSFEKTSTTATCTSAGKATYTCSVCTTTKEEDEAAFGHSFTNYVSQNNATCTKDGTKIATCDNGCGTEDEITDEGTKLPHDYESKVTAPTCTTQGYTSYTCVHCGDEYQADFVDALGHTPKTTVVKEAEIGVEGLQRTVCTVCGALIDERAIPALVENDTTFIAKYKLFRVVAGVESAKVAVDFEKDIDGYEVYVASGDGDFKKRGTINDEDKNYLVLSNLTANKNYKFKLRAYKKIDGEKVYSKKFSEKISVRIQNF